MAATDAAPSNAAAEEQTQRASSSAGSSGEPAPDSEVAAGSEAAPTLRSRIAELKREQALTKARNKELTKELRNKQRRNKRLKEKVGGLDDADLIDVLRMRDEKKRGRQGPSSEPVSGASEASSPALSRRRTQVGLDSRMGDTP